MKRTNANPGTIMPGKTAKQIAAFTSDLDALMQEARLLVPPAKSDAIMRKWIADADLEGVLPFRTMCALADAAMLVGELMLFNPSASGATALDRLARRQTGRTAGQKAALDALLASRFVLLTVTADMPGGEIAARDFITGEDLRLAMGDLPPGLAGTPVFGRLVPVGDGAWVLAGIPTPLDPAALAVATAHPAARLSGPYAGARWAEAIYSHVVRHGTLDIPGVNRPREMEAMRDGDEEVYGDAEVEELVVLGRAWAELDGAAPDEELLRRSRQFCSPDAIASAVIGLAVASRRRKGDLASGLERLVLVQMETAYRRERMGSETMSLDGVADLLDGLIAEQGLPAHARDIFEDFRKRAAGSILQGGIEDAELSRLLQRIRGLRAKTVDQGCTEQEALAAAEKVAELLDRYGLSLGELDFQAQPCDGVAVQTTRKRLVPLDDCVPAIAAFFDCRVWGENPGGGPLRYLFFGLRADITAALYLYELVERAFETETELFRAGPVYAGLAGNRRSAVTSFQNGLASGIRDKLKAIRAVRAKRQSSGRDLVLMKAALVDEEVAKLGLRFKVKSASSSRPMLADAFAAGTQAAERFDYTPGIGQAA